MDAVRGWFEYKKSNATLWWVLFSFSQRKSGATELEFICYTNPQIPVSLSKYIHPSHIPSQSTLCTYVRDAAAWRQAGTRAHTHTPNNLNHVTPQTQ